MSRIVSVDSLSNEELNKISDELMVQKEESKYSFSSSPEFITLYELKGNQLTVPFSYNRNFPRRERKEFPVSDIKFVGELRPNQKEVKKEAITILNNTGAVIIACATGYGKTITSINIASKIGLKTLAISHRIVLINQWKQAFERFCPESTCQILTTKTKKKNCDFYIMNASNISKRDISDYDDIGCVIVDECHIIMAEKLSESLRYLNPRYLIGLSATPYRSDGLNVLIDMYFGKNKIIRKLWRKHTVYKVDTGFVPEVKQNKMGKVDWCSVIDSTCNNEDRNEIIINIVKKFKDNVFLILCKRVSQAQYLEKRLKEENEDTTSLIGKNQDYEQKSRILVGTVGKCSVGFDHPRLNALILASDVEQYFVQYLGRVFRREDTIPIIFDLVDDFPLLYKHFRTRCGVYKEHGGICKNFLTEFPEFKRD